jgi:hypothetical protein
MLEGIIEFWNALKPKVDQAVTERTGNCLRVDRFDVVAAPSNGKISVRQPYGRTISIPYCKEVATATAGDTVLVIWWGSLSTGKAWCFGDGPK